MDVFNDRPKPVNFVDVAAIELDRLDGYFVNTGSVSAYYADRDVAPSQSRLTEPMEVALREAVGDDPTKRRDNNGILAVALQKGGVFTVCDMFAAGRMATHRISRVGDMAKGRLALVAASFEGEVEWYDEPTPKDIAQICPTLGDVPSVTLGKIAVVPDYYSSLRRVSVADVLDLGSPERLLDTMGLRLIGSNLLAADATFERALDIAELYGN